eukprot:TRINITY_DN40332_c0_g1_i1.p1 TRINITY_DN40332_c0_g1~~TRINITY_DN40332_c0_g1_i1.p1  ORF type:complete len:350 (+),score=123.55 TRINITY_DN40332_c0_g1_i1:830-1879(+)
MIKRKVAEVVEKGKAEMAERCKVFDDYDYTPPPGVVSEAVKKAGIDAARRAATRSRMQGLPREEAARLAASAAGHAAKVESEKEGQNPAQVAKAAGYLAAHVGNDWERSPEEVAAFAGQAMKNAGAQQGNVVDAAGAAAKDAAEKQAMPPGKQIREEANAMKAAGGSVQDVVETARERKEEDKVEQREEMRTLEQQRKLAARHAANTEAGSVTYSDDDYGEACKKAKWTREYCMYKDQAAKVLRTEEQCAELQEGCAWTVPTRNFKGPGGYVCDLKEPPAPPPPTPLPTADHGASFHPLGANGFSPSIPTVSDAVDVAKTASAEAVAASSAGATSADQAEADAADAEPQ